MRPANALGRLGIGVACTLACLSGWARRAHAQDITDPGTNAGTLPTPAPDVLKRQYWSAGESRAFLASTIEVGLFYVRTQLAAGLGRPHWRWLGVEVHSRMTGAGAAEYAGLRFALPFLELRTGARYSFAVNQAYLPPQATYTQDDVEAPDSPRSHYGSLEAELSGSVSVLGGTLFGVVGAYRIVGVPDDYFVFDELLHVVVDPPWVGRARVGHLLAFGKDSALRVGAAGEVITVPERDALVVRVGPQLTVALTHHLDANASLMAVAASPDSLRLLGAEIGQFGFRYKWATGEPFPEFP